MQFFVPGIPVPKGSAKAFANKHTGKIQVMQTNREKQRPWAASIAYFAKEAGANIISGPVSISMFFRMPRPKSHYGTGKNAEVVKPASPDHHTSKPDLDKLVRCVKDALTGVVWTDDSQVCHITALKYYDPSPGVWIEINRHGDFL